jgi:hypothetical protein
MGPAGPTGPAGPAGGSGVSGYEIVSTPVHSNNLGVGMTLTARAACPTGKRVIGGGAQSINAYRYLAVTSSYPDGSSQNAWYGEVRNQATVPAGSADLIVYAICVIIQ